MRGARLWRLAVAGVLGAAAALLVACGASGKNLIPVTDAGTLQSDFNAIASAVASGDCTGANQALAKAQADVSNLPRTVDPRLRARLQQGLSDLQQTAPVECKKNQTSTQTTTTTTTTAPTTTTTTTTAPPTTTTAPPTTTTAPPTTTTPPTTDTTTTPTDGSGGTPPGTPGAGSGGAPPAAGGAGAGAAPGAGAGAGGTPGQ
jgi:hypothetical protein